MVYRFSMILYAWTSAMQVDFNAGCFQANYLIWFNLLSIVKNIWNVTLGVYRSQGSQGLGEVHKLASFIKLAILFLLLIIWGLQCCYYLVWTDSLIYFLFQCFCCSPGVCFCPYLIFLFSFSTFRILYSINSCESDWICPFVFTVFFLAPIVGFITFVKFRNSGFRWFLTSWQMLLILILHLRSNFVSQSISLQSVSGIPIFVHDWMYCTQSYFLSYSLFCGILSEILSKRSCFDVWIQVRISICSW